MSSPYGRRWHRGSVFGEGFRHPLDRERRAQWRARIDLHRRAKRLTGDQSYVALALLRHLGADGRCDPDHETLAVASGQCVGTVKEALKRLAGCGLLSWVRRLIRVGNHVRQTSNSYLLTLGNPPPVQPVRCKATTRLGIRREDVESVHRPAFDVPESDRIEALQALARVAANRRATFEASCSERGGGCVSIARMS